MQFSSFLFDHFATEQDNLREFAFVMDFQKQSS